MKSHLTKSRTALAAGLMVCLTAPFGLVACDRETSTHKESTSKVVDTPEGKKKVTETTETTTTHDPK
jgi:hypothetical protein